jgi:hypothetical protein
MHSSYRRVLPVTAGLIMTALTMLCIGCGHAAARPSPGQSLTPSASAPTITVSGKTAIIVDEHANGKSVTVTVGAPIKLLLHNSYWNISASSRPDVLAEIGVPTWLPVTPTCGAGMGCNPVQAIFTALRPGTAVLSASRMSCGEAMLCAPAQRHFQVTVVVTQ